MKHHFIFLLQVLNGKPPSRSTRIKVIILEIPAGGVWGVLVFAEHSDFFKFLFLLFCSSSQTFVWRYFRPLYLLRKCTLHVLLHNITHDTFRSVHSLCATMYLLFRKMVFHSVVVHFWRNSLLPLLYYRLMYKVFDHTYLNQDMLVFTEAWEQ